MYFFKDNDSISKIQIFSTYSVDTGKAIAIVATIGFIGFPGIALLVPFVMSHDPASHIAITLMPKPHYSSIRPILAGLLQGSMACFGAIVCLQMLFVFILITLSMGEMMNYAITDDNLGRGPRDLEDCANTVINSDPHKAQSLMKIIKNVRKSLDREAKYFRPSLMIHRQLTIIQRVAFDCLMGYTPGLLFVGMGLIVITLYFSIRFHLPLAMFIPNTVITVTVTLILVGLTPVAESVDHASNSFRKFWTRRIRFELAKKLLLSCRHCILIPIGTFANYRRGTHLLLWNIILQQLATLLINF